jgi:hypothetical protein
MSALEDDESFVEIDHFESSEASGGDDRLAAIVIKLQSDKDNTLVRFGALGF